MSYPDSNDPYNQLNGNGSFAVGGVGGAIVMGLRGPIAQVNILGNTPGVNFGDTSGPNAVNPSGTASGITLPTQNNFRNVKK